MRSDVANLWLRLAIPFAVFVIAGSLALLGFLNLTYQQRSLVDFQQLADTNANFIRTMGLPPTDRFAGYLGSVLGVDVRFLPETAPLPALGRGQEMVVAPLGNGWQLLMVRDVVSLASLLLQPRSWLVVGGFWSLSLALAWALAWGLVRPYLATQRRLASAERLATLGKMASSLAHEIQNPVAAIRLHGQIIDAETAEERAAAVDTILQETDRIENLVNQWMFLTKPEPPRTTTVDVADLLREVIRRARPLADHAHVELRLSLTSVCCVVADRRRLAQVFGNLVTNAIQAMPQGGTVQLTAVPVDHLVQVQVEDTGRGFSSAALERCPTLFYSEREGGMGIGLSVADEIVRAHGGQLRIANRADGGARVTVTLPRTEAS